MTDARFPIDPADLRQSGPGSQRWLSVPFSRIVVNPYDFNSAPEMTHAAYSDRPTVPLNLGYLDPYTENGTGVWMNDFLTLYGRAQGTGTSRLLACLEDLSGRDPVTSGKDHTAVRFDGGKLCLKVKNGAPTPWQYVAFPLTLDASEPTLITLRIDRCEGHWALKFCPDGGADATLVPDTAQTGQISLDPSGCTGGAGPVRGLLKLFSIGYERELVLGDLKVRTLSGSFRAAGSFSTAWTPSATEFSASFPEGPDLSGFDTFTDPETVVRTVRIRTGGPLCAVVRTGHAVSWDDGVLTVDAGTRRVCLGVDRDVRPSFYPSLSDLLCETGGSVDPAGSEYALYDLGRPGSGETVTFSVSVTSDRKTAAQCAAQARAGLEKGGGERARRDRDAYWRDYLSRVPVPGSFGLRAVPDLGVTEDGIIQMYEIAWIFLCQDILPPNPETDYPYPQIACGKPAMWAYGDRPSAYSASWESFFGMQLLGYVMPDVAWDALTGLVSLVDEDGMLGGESLPSEKAHTAWLLYRLTGDRNRLEGLRQGIGRYLDWRMENPRWIYLDHNDPNCADADFVVAALLDLEYMEDICAALDRAAERENWEQKRRAFLRNYYLWNFDASGNVCQLCDRTTLARRPGYALWCTKGLWLRDLDGVHEDALYRAFRSEYDESASFGGFRGVKYPETAGTVEGLAATGRLREARGLAECCVRDVVRVGMLSENYTNDPAPLPTGVRPAMFGTAMLIDSLLFLNGWSVQRARPSGLCGTVSNLTLRENRPKGEKTP